MACIRLVQEPRILQKSKNNNKLVNGAKQRSTTTPKTIFVFLPKERQTWDGKEGREYSGGEALKERCVREETGVGIVSIRKRTVVTPGVPFPCNAIVLSWY